MLFVSKNAIAFRWKSVSPGFGPRVFLQWFLRALVDPVVVLSCFVIPFFWLTRGLILMVVFFNVSSSVVIVCFVSLVSMPLIVILSGMVSLLMFCPVLTRPSLPFCAEILMLFLIIVSIVLGSAPDDTSRESSSSLTHLFSCVVDIWRQLHPSVPGFTWSRWDGLCSCRIDLIGCPFSWLSTVSSCDIVPCPFSDHSAVLLSSSVPQAVPMGSGLWKLNVSVLEEPDYFRSFLIFGPVGGIECLLSLLSLIGGRWENRTLKG